MSESGDNQNPSEQYQNEENQEEQNEEENENKTGTRRKSKYVKPKKVHRGPPPPIQEDLDTLEKKFILDCIAVNSICKDYSFSQPKLGPAIPAYNSQKDKHVCVYFKRAAVPEVLRETGQNKGGTSIDGPVIDRFAESGAGYRYLHARNDAPGAAKSGHSHDQVNGHAQFLSDVRPNFSYNGQFGYRRNTPWLRQSPSSFGLDPRSPTQGPVQS